MAKEIIIDWGMEMTLSSRHLRGWWVLSLQKGSEHHLWFSTSCGVHRRWKGLCLGRRWRTDQQRHYDCLPVSTRMFDSNYNYWHYKPAKLRQLNCQFQLFCQTFRIRVWCCTLSDLAVLFCSFWCRPAPSERYSCWSCDLWLHPQCSLVINEEKGHL